jgi:hypothetical protein
MAASGVVVGGRDCPAAVITHGTVLSSVPNVCWGARPEASGRRPPASHRSSPVTGWWPVTGHPPLGGAEGVGGGQAGGADRRVQPGDRTQHQRGGDPAGHP